MRVDHIMFDVTDRCNLNCKHCYKSNMRGNTDIDINMVIPFLEDLKDRGRQPGIVLSGGEPLMFDDLIPLLEYICDGRKVRINTNGIFLSQFDKVLSQYTNLVLQISLDGYDDNTFYSIRNSHMFDKIIENAICAKEKGINLYFRATLSSITLHHYENFISLSKKINIPLVIRPMYNTGEPGQNDLRVEFDDLCEWQEKAIQDGNLEYLGGRNLISESSCPLLHTETIYSTLTVDNKGNVYPCQLLRSNLFYMGNIYCDPYEVIFSEKTIPKKQIQKIINSDSCVRCGFRNNFGDGTCLSACYLGNKTCVKNKIIGGI